MGYYYRLTTMANIKKINHIKCFQGYERTGGNIKWYIHFGKEFGNFLKS